MPVSPDRIPPLIIGLVMLAYWARVIRLVLKAKRKTGRGAGLVPTEPLGRALRLAWYPAVALWIIYPITYALSRELPAFFRPYPLPQGVAWGATLVALVAFGATLVCWKKMGGSWRMGIDPNEKTRLILTGPYAYVRHPIYALSSLLMLMTIVILPSPLMLIIGTIHITLIQWEASREEKYLIGLHGDAYARYRASVGRMIPRSLVPYQPA